MEYKLSDSLIAQVAKSLQIALLTGTDIVDNLRLIRVEVDGDQIVTSEKSKEAFDQGIARMMEAIDFKKIVESINEK